MKKLNPAQGKARREEYDRLRLEGAASRAAAQAVGVTDATTQRLYERWFLAAHPEVTPEPPRQRFPDPYQAGSAS